MCIIIIFKVCLLEYIC